MATVLVVEDDKLLGKLLSSSLDKAGFTVMLAINGLDAFVALKDNKIDLIYLDIMLPGDMNGYDILNKLKDSNSPYLKIPVIMLSNLGQMNEINKAISMGAKDYIIKANINLEDIVNKTKSLVL
jgi:DNA-binding response OmpR family regulator